MKLVMYEPGQTLIDHMKSLEAAFATEYGVGYESSLTRSYGDGGTSIYYGITPVIRFLRGSLERNKEAARMYLQLRTLNQLNHDDALKAVEQTLPVTWRAEK